MQHLYSSKIRNMFRFFTKGKKVPLGRWNTDKPITVSMRLADLANYDSCGTCGIPRKKKSVPETFVAVADDVIDIGYNPLPGSFDIYKQKKLS